MTATRMTIEKYDVAAFIGRRCTMTNVGRCFSRTAVKANGKVSATANPSGRATGTPRVPEWGYLMDNRTLR